MERVIREIFETDMNPSDPFVALLHSFTMAAVFIRISQTGL